MKKFLKVGCLGFIAIIVIGVIIAIASNKGDGDDPKSASAQVNASDASGNGSASAAPKKTEEKKMKTIGEELKVGDVVFKVNETSTTKEIKDGNFLSYKPSSEGSVFLIVNVTVKNTGKERINTDSSYFELRKGDIKYAPSTLITTDNKFFVYEGINPGLAQTGNVAFEIPENEKDFILNVQTGFWGTEQGQIQLYK